MLIPKKSLGQNFLIDKNICKKIVKNFNIKNKTILEIGPGTGQLTEEIIKLNPHKLLLIEKDNNLSLILKKKYNKNTKIIIHNNDINSIDIIKLGKVNIISNLPYNISTNLIINLLINFDNINEMLFMVQKEVANKFLYIENSKKNKYNLFLKIICDLKILFNISNNVFYPKPKINSSIIKILPKNMQITLIFT